MTVKEDLIRMVKFLKKHSFESNIEQALGKKSCATVVYQSVVIVPLTLY